MNQIINYIKTNCNTRLSCLNALMNVYHLFRYKEELHYITESEAFDIFADNSLQENQELCSEIYVLIDSGNIDEAITYYSNNLK